MFRKILTLTAVFALLISIMNINLTTGAAVFSNQEQEGDEAFETNSAGGVGKSNLGPLSSFGGGHRSLYMDPAFVPYIHPRLVYEEEVPPQDFVPPKRAAKGALLVDVVDFVTKGSGNRGQRMGGQDMRSSGRK